MNTTTQEYAKIDKVDAVVKVIFTTDMVPQWTGDLNVDPLFHIVPVPSNLAGLVKPFKWKYEGEIFHPLPEVQEIDRRSEQVRSLRNGALSRSDWTQSVDAPFSDVTKQAWATYRQALRDLTSQPTFPDVVWPTKPE